MLVSILHRVTGDGLAIFGSLILLWWLGAAAAGASHYDRFIGYASSIPGQIILIGLTWAVLQHAASGIRHMVLDTGAGYELKSNRMWSMVIAAMPLLLTAALWLFIYYGKV